MRFAWVVVMVVLVGVACSSSAPRQATKKYEPHVGPTPLSLAIWDGDLPRVRELLAGGADPTELERGDNTAWLWAFVAGEREALKLTLAASGNKPLELSEAGLTLRFAAGLGDRELVREMLRRGANVDEKHDGRANALLVAASNGDIEMVRLLLDAGAAVNAADTHGDTPLMGAVRDGHAETIRLLLARGADAAARDRAGRSAVDWARRDGRAEIIALVAKEGGATPRRAGRDARAAIAASLPLLQRGAATWDEQAECLSCHHHPMLARVLGEADARGVTYDPALATTFRAKLREVTSHITEEHVAALKEPDGALRKSMDNGGDHAYAVAWFGGALLHQPTGVQLGAPTLQLLPRMQRPDGRWRHGPSRIPIESSDIATTALAIQVLAQLDATSSEGARARAARWLRQQQPVTLQDAAFHLLGVAWSNGSPDERRAAAEALVARQNPDGGWAHRPGRTSDAYGTGLALYALRVSGASADAAHARGIAYLLTTQEPDGSWLVHTRAAPFVPYFESGFPHGKFQFISYAGTAWATIALLGTLEPR